MTSDLSDHAAEDLRGTPMTYQVHSAKQAEYEREHPTLITPPDLTDPSNPSNVTGDLEPVRGPNEHDWTYGQRLNEYLARCSFLVAETAAGGTLPPDELAQVRKDLEAGLDAAAHGSPIGRASDDEYSYQLHLDGYRAEERTNLYKEALRRLIDGTTGPGPILTVD